VSSTIPRNPASNPQPSRSCAPNEKPTSSDIAIKVGLEALQILASATASIAKKLASQIQPLPQPSVAEVALQHLAALEEARRHRSCSFTSCDGFENVFLEENRKKPKPKGSIIKFGSLDDTKIQASNYYPELLLEMYTAVHAIDKLLPPEKIDCNQLLQIIAQRLHKVLAPSQNNQTVKCSLGHKDTFIIHFPEDYFSSNKIRNKIELFFGDSLSLQVTNSDEAEQPVPKYLLGPSWIKSLFEVLNAEELCLPFFKQQDLDADLFDQIFAFEEKRQHLAIKHRFEMRAERRGQDVKEDHPTEELVQEDQESPERDSEEAFDMIPEAVEPLLPPVDQEATFCDEELYRSDEEENSRR
jgi:hypothetical protein